jgi:hypothetical protein
MYYSTHVISELPRAVFIPLLIVVGTASGMLVYLAVERPVQQIRRRRRSLEQAGEPGFARQDVAETVSATGRADDSSR